MRWIARIVVTLLVLSALLISLARYALPGYIESHKDEILARLSAMAEQPIEADSLSVVWRGDGPGVVMQNLRLYDKARTRANLRADKVMLKFSLLEMLRHSNLTPESIALTGIHLVLIRQQDGSLSVHGIEQQAPDDQEADESAGDADISALLLQPNSLELNDARITLVDLLSESRPLYFAPVNMQIEKRGERHSLAAALSVENGQQGDLTLIADLAMRGEESLLFWSGDIYMRTGSLNLAWLMQNRIPGHYDLERANADMEAWSYWKDGRMKRLEGRMLTTDLRFRSLRAVKAPTLELDRLGGRFRWLREPSGWRLDVHQPTISKGLDHWPTQALSIALRRFSEEKPPELFIGADVLDIDTFMQALSVHPPKSAVVDHLLKSGLRGKLQRPYMHLRMQEPMTWQFSGLFEQLSAYGTYSVPELENYTIEVKAGNTGGRLRFKTEDASMFARNLFRWPIPVNLFQGDIQWRKVREGYWYVQSDSLAFENDHVKTLTNFKLHADGDKPLWLDLETAFHDGDGAYASIYYPASIMPEESLKWLDTSIRHGKVKKGTARIRGELVPEMFRSIDSGLFEVVAEIEDAQLKYHPEWPAIDAVTGRLRFFGNTLTVEADTGRIYDNPIETATSYMTLNPLSPVHVKGAVGGDLEGPLRILAETPLKEQFGPLVKALEVSGKGKVTLDIDIPVKEGHKLRLESRVAFSGARVVAREAGVTLDDLRGSVMISEKGVSADKLETRIFGLPATLDIKPRKRDTLVSTNMPLSASELTKLAGRALPVTGKSRWNIVLSIPSLKRLGAGNMRMTATSNLQGMGVQLPLSFTKDAKSKRAIKVAWQPGGTRGLEIAYGGLTLKSDARGKLLTGTLDADDLKGSLRYPLTGGPLVMDLERLAVNLELDANSATNAKSRLEPYDIPPLQITAKQFLINGGNFGRMTLKTAHTKKGHELVELKTRGKLAVFAATGTWNKSGRSQLNGILSSQQLGATLKKLDVTDQLIKAKGSIEATLEWKGGLLDFSMDKAVGTVVIHTSDGRFASANPGFGRLLGLVNVAALKRRLKLDFSDFAREGFAFDTINGRIKLADGKATLKPVTIKAPSADITVIGTIDLTTQGLDQQITVLPDIHGALPLAATAAGGPAAGAAALVIGKLAGKKIDRIGRIKYKVTGTWDKPDIARIGGRTAAEQESIDVDDPLADFQ